MDEVERFRRRLKAIVRMAELGADVNMFIESEVEIFKLRQDITNKAFNALDVISNQIKRERGVHIN